MPYLVVAQWRRLDRYRRRVVVPLVRRDAVGPTEPGLNPIIRVGDEELVLHPLDLATVPVDRLGDPVGSLREEGDRIIAAIDLALLRAWG